MSAGVIIIAAVLALLAGSGAGLGAVLLYSMF